MFLELPVWPAVSFGELPVLMIVEEIEAYAPAAFDEVELAEDATLDEARRIAGGLAVYCRRERERLSKLGLST